VPVAIAILSVATTHQERLLLEAEGRVRHGDADTVQLEEVEGWEERWKNGEERSKDEGRLR
jgi:hypothetical protein